MRYFIALEIPSENIPEFQSIQNKLHTLIPQSKLTELGKIHLTIAFIGEQDENLKDQLIQVIKTAVEGVQAFEVTPAYIDGFPSIHHPDVLWVGVKDDIDKVLLIRERVKDGLAGLNLPVDERRFVPHITIAKISGFRVGRDLEEKLQELMNEYYEPIKITSIKLFESIPDGSFHTHNTLAEINFMSYS